jgi:hypothetical protein
MTEYTLTRASLNTITDVEMAFGTEKLLPPYEAVPEEFKRGNSYTRLMDSLFSGQSVPEGEIVFRKDFDDPEAPAQLNRVVIAHLRSYSPKHEHKIAGLGFLVSLACEVRLR